MEGAVCKALSEDEPPEEVMEEWKELFAKHGLKMSLQKFRRSDGGVEGAVCKAWSEDEPSEEVTE